MEVRKTKTINLATIFTIAICSFFTSSAQALLISDYVSNISINQVWDYGDPTDSEDLMYEFNLEIIASADKAILMNSEVERIEFLTPVGYTFEITKEAGQWSDNIWTAYEYTSGNGGEAKWEYKARFADQFDLLNYNYGMYKITLHLKSGGAFQTTALFFGSQPTQEPILITPTYNQTIDFPISFSWEPCIDTKAETIWIEMYEQISGVMSGTTVGTDVTTWDPGNLIQGLWEVSVLFAHYDGYLNEHNIWIDTDNFSRSIYWFTIIGGSTEEGNINISKSVVDEGSIAAGDTITYKISIDTLDLTEEVTDVYLIDNLPDEVSFVSDTAPFGFYDEDEHRYIWISASLAPGTTREFLITVQIDTDVPLGTEITNSATIDCDGKSSRTASVSFAIDKDMSLLEIEDVQVTSGTIIRDNISGDVTISMGMPEGIVLDDINTEVPIVLDLGEEQIAADTRKFEEINGKLRITVYFDTVAILEVLTGYGQFDVEVTGLLNDGRTFSGQTTLTIAGTEVNSDYISKIHFEQTCNYENPADSNDDTCEFYIKISAESDKANNMNADVNGIEVLTPAGHVFLIPKLPGQLFGDIWTSYEYTSDETEEAVWEYRIALPDMAGLQDYGDGQYAITLHYNDENQSTTTAWFGIEDMKNPLAQPPEPMIKYPLPNKIVESPVTFSWESLADANVSNIFIALEEKINGGYREENFGANKTSWGPVYLANGRWTAMMIAENSSYIAENGDGIEIESYKCSQSMYDFKVINYLTNTYEVWGGDIWISPLLGSYGSIADMNDYGYERLSDEPNSPGTFSGKYNYYVIATKGEFLLDSIHGSNDSYYSEIGTIIIKENITDEMYLLGKTDGLCATVGNNNPSEDYSGWLVLVNTNAWEGLTVTTRKLNLSKKAINTPEELENISPGDTITYMITFDSSELLYDINNVTIIDYLPEEVNCISADTNEVPGFYDANEHTFTWSIPAFSWGSTINLPLTVEVNMGVAPDTIITNFVTIDSNETPAAVASEPVTVSKNLQRESIMQINPPTISRYGTDVSGVMVILELPSDVSEEQVNEDEPLVLTLDSEESSESVLANADQDATTYGGITYVLAVFDKTQLLNAIPGYGQKKIKVEGKLIEGSFIGTGILTIN